MSATAVLSVRDLVVEIASPDGPTRVLDGVSFDVLPREVFGMVGESGSGKSLTMLAIMGLLPAQARIVQGQILFEGRDLVTLNEAALRRIRGRSLSMIFQDPTTSFNPVLRIGSQIGEIIRLHQSGLSRSQVRDRVIALLALVGVPNPEQRYSQYPLQFSGGMRQRAMIAMAIANDPDLLIADEPTTALDVSIQAQVMDVLADVRARTGAAMILITHDLGLVAETADRAAVMYAGRVAETAIMADLFMTPSHPYSVGLMTSLPRIGAVSETLYSIPGQPPDPRSRPQGCVFHPRCERANKHAGCYDIRPELRPVSLMHDAACHFAETTPEWARRILARDALVVP